MKLAIEGVIKSPKGKNRLWAIGVPLLELYTQGRSKIDAFKMIRDAVEVAVNKKGFKVHVSEVDECTFALSTDDFTTLVAFMLRQQRLSRSMSLRAVSDVLGSRSPNSYRRYETGESSTSLEKLVELMGAVSTEKYLLLKAG